jgi:hypothetical protein
MRWTSTVSLELTIFDLHLVWIICTAFWISGKNHEEPNNTVFYQYNAHEWNIIVARKWLIYFWYSEYKNSFTVYYIECVIPWLLFNANSAILQLHHGENKLIFNEMMMRSALFKTNTLSWMFIVLAHWNNSPRVNTSLHSDTLFWFRANQSLLFLLNAACLEEK